MKNFLTYTLATLTGIFLSTLLFFILILIIVAASTAEKPVDVKPNTVLYMELQDRIVDRTVETPLYYLPSRFPVVREMGLNDILDNISKAKKDDNIRGIYMELTSIAAGMGTTEEIRNALLDFKGGVHDFIVDGRTEFHVREVPRRDHGLDPRDG